MSNLAWILAGSNLGDRSVNLRNAFHGLGKVAKVTRASMIYETEAWGITDQPSFFNQVVEIKSEVGPKELLKHCLETEKSLGRVRLEKWGSRVIDLDILYFNNEVIIDDDLVIPHPGIPERRFTLVPLVELAPDYIHPVLHKTNRQLLNECTDGSSVEPFPHL